MKRKSFCSLLAAALLIISDCTGQGKTEQVSNDDIPINSEQTKVPETSSKDESLSKEKTMNYTYMTSFTKAVPPSYKTAVEHGGSVEQLDYTSLDYARDMSPVTK